MRDSQNIPVYLLMKVLIWNCNGAASKCFLRTLKDILYRHEPTILGLVETKCSGEHANNICKRVGYDYWIRVEALGYSVGILLFWEECVDLYILQTHPQFIHAKIISNDSHSWLLTIVYDSPNCTLRKYLWQDLNQNVVNLEEPWVVAGDFN